MKYKIAIGGDHAGFLYKQEIIKMLNEKGFEVVDFGPHSLDSVDYPDFANPLSKSLNEAQNNFGILICGSGNGVAMTANKYPNVRAALCWNSDIVSLARQHNNANVLCLPARFIGLEYAKQLVDIFLTTEFEGGRHQNRVAKIGCV